MTFEKYWMSETIWVFLENIHWVKQFEWLLHNLMSEPIWMTLENIQQVKQFEWLLKNLLLKILKHFE